MRPSAANVKHCEVEIIFDNTTERPLRVTKLEVIALDRESFVVRRTSGVPEVTVEPRAKERLWIELPAAADQLDKVRIWGVAHALPE